MRAWMPGPFEPCLTVNEQTHDGFAEIELTVNGHVIARTVCGPGDEVVICHEWWRKYVDRKC